MVKSRVILFTIFLFLLLSFGLYKQYKEVPYHEDEHTYISRTIFFYLYKNLQFNNPVWYTFETYDPKLPELVYGFVLYAHGIKSLQPYLSSIEFNSETDQEVTWSTFYSRHYHGPISGLPLSIYKRIQPILLARKASLMFAIGSLILIFIIVAYMEGWLFGYLAAILVYSNPLYSQVMLQAMGDAPLIFFILLQFFLSLTFIKTLAKTSNQKVSLVMIIFAAITSALAVSSKLNGILTLLYVFILLIYLHQMKRVAQAQFLLYLTVVVVAFCGTLLLINPHLWPSPASNFITMFSERISLYKGQQAEFPEHALSDFTTRISIVTHRTLYPEGTYTNFSRFFGAIPIDIILVLLGLSMCLKAISSRSNIGSQLSDASIIWMFIFGGSLFLFLPLDWNRYYLPLVIVIILLEARGLALITSVFNRLVKTFLQS